MQKLLRRYPVDCLFLFGYAAWALVAYAGKPYSHEFVLVFYCAATLWLVVRPFVAFRMAVKDDSKLAAIAMTKISAGEFIWGVLKLPLVFGYLPVTALLFYHVLPPPFDHEGWEKTWQHYGFAAINVTVPSAMCADLCAKLAKEKDTRRIGRRVLLWTGLLMSCAYIEYNIWWLFYHYNPWGQPGLGLDYILFGRDVLLMAGNLFALLITYTRWQAAVRELFVFH